MTERIPSPGFSEEERSLIEALRNAPDAPETEGSFRAWYDAEAEKADTEDTGRANAEFTLKRARLYHAAGMDERAWDELNDLRLQASGEHAEDLLALAEALMDEIDRSS